MTLRASDRALHLRDSDARTAFAFMRFHPLTAGVVLAVLGTFVVVNCVPSAGRNGYGSVQGWPLTFKKDEMPFETLEMRIGPGGVFLPKVPPPITLWNYPALLVNILLAVLSAAATGIVCQRLVRRTQPAV
jgi:hypothetical protein